MAEQQVGTRVVVSGADETMQAQQRIYVMGEKLRAQGEKSAAVASKIAGKQRELAATADMAGTSTKALSAKFAGLASLGNQGSVSFVKLTSTLGAVGPVMEAVQARFTTINAQGTKTVSTMGKVAGSLGAIAGPAAIVVAVAGALGSALGALFDKMNSLDGVVAKLNTTFDRSADGMRKVAQAQRELGITFATGTEAVKALAAAHQEGERFAEATRLTTEHGADATLKHLDALAAMRGELKGMTTGELMRFREAVEKEVAALKASGEEVGENVLALQQSIEFHLRADDAVKRSTDNFQRQGSAVNDLTAQQTALAEEMESIRSVSDLSSDGLEALLSRVTMLDKGTEANVETWERFGETLNSDVLEQLKRLGLSVADAEEALAKMRDTGMSARDAIRDLGGASSIGNATQALAKQAEAQAAAWKAEADKRAEYEKEQIAELAATVEEKYGVAFTNVMAGWRQQWDIAIVNGAELMEARLKAIGSALSSAASSASKQSGQERGESFGQGVAQSVSSGTQSGVEGVNRVDTRIKTLEDELRVMRQRFFKGGSYKQVEASKKEELAALERQRREMLGEGKSLGDQQNERWEQMKSDQGMSLGDREIARQLERNAKAAERTADGVAKVAGFTGKSAAVAEKTLRETADVAGLLTASGMTAKESARHLATMAQQSKMPDAALPTGPVTGNMRTGGSSGSRAGFG